MSISCSCSDDYEWYYELSELDYSANSTGKCYGCGERVSIGQPCGRIWSYEYDENGDETDSEVAGRMCEQCLDMVENFLELGYCLEAGKGFVKTAYNEYLELLPPNHRTDLKKEVSR